jgi:hypothetical protein
LYDPKYRHVYAGMKISAYLKPEEFKLCRSSARRTKDEDPACSDKTGIGVRHRANSHMPVLKSMIRSCHYRHEGDTEDLLMTRASLSSNRGQSTTDDEGGYSAHSYSGQCHSARRKDLTSQGQSYDPSPVRGKQRFSGLAHARAPCLVIYFSTI